MWEDLPEWSREGSRGGERRTGAWQLFRRWTQYASIFLTQANRCYFCLLYPTWVTEVLTNNTLLSILWIIFITNPLSPVWHRRTKQKSEEGSKCGPCCPNNSAEWLSLNHSFLQPDSFIKQAFSERVRRMLEELKREPMQQNSMLRGETGWFVHCTHTAALLPKIQGVIGGVFWWTRTLLQMTAIKMGIQKTSQICHACLSPTRRY